MQKRTEYRRWSNNQLVEEYVCIEDDDVSIVQLQQQQEEQQEEEQVEHIECGFRGEYGETEDIMDDDEDEGEDRAGR